MAGFPAQKKIIFDVIETFNGVSSKTVEITTSLGGGGDCGFPFEEGRDYLVYAVHYQGSLGAGICSRTAPAERAASDLAYLRSLARGGPPARLYGFVTGGGNRIGIELKLSEKAPHPLPNVTLHLESATTSKQTVTDSEGNYAFEGLPAGTFAVSADMPRSLGGGERRSVSLREHACSEQDFIAVERAQLTGRLLDGKRLPVPNTWVAMMPVGSRARSDVVTGFTNQRGAFVIQGIPPGDFVLGVNISAPPGASKYLSQPYPPSYFPGVANRAAASIIHVNSAQQLTGFELGLPPPLKQRTISGSVRWPDGRLAVGAFVELKDSEFADNVDLRNSDRHGTFTVTGVEGRSYSVRGLVGISKGESPMHSETVQLRPDENGPIRLVLSQPGKP